MATHTIEQTKNDALVHAPDSMLTIIERAVMAPDFDVNKLQQLLELRERFEKTEARKAFFEAMNAFKENPPTINKNKAVSYGTTNYSHATLDHVCDQITKALSQHGITHRWKVEQESQLIKVTCILSKGIHSEETTLSGSPDNTGSKNSIQSIGSTVTYLQRYTLLAATGLAAANTDNDGKGGAAAKGIASDRLQEQCEWIANARNLDELKTLYRNAYQEADAVKDRRACSAYIAAKDARKKELQ